MASDDDAPLGAPPSASIGAPAPARPCAATRPYVRFSAKVARAVCIRIASGETQVSVSSDPDMPSRSTVGRWARELPKFAQILARAKALSGREGVGPNSTWCPLTAHEIAARVAEGETLTAIAADPAMPSMGTIFYWRKSKPEFDEALRLAREALAERFSDLGWQMALAATPQTAYLTRVQLGQLRWTAAILGPRTHGRLKPSAPPEPPEVTDVTLRTFQTEVNPETGQVRGVALHFDPETGEVEHRPSGDWRDPKFPLVRHVDYATAKKTRMALGMNTDNPGLWDTRPSAADDPQG